MIMKKFFLALTLICLSAYAKEPLKGFLGDPLPVIHGGTGTTTASGSPFALKDLSNLNSTAVNQDLLPSSGGSNALGSSSNYWSSLYVNDVFSAVNTSLTLTAQGNGDIVLTPGSTRHVNIGPNNQLFMAGSGAPIFFLDDSSSKYVGFVAPTAVTTTTLWTLPLADGTNGQVLSTDGSGNLSWASGGGGGGANTALSNLSSVAINTPLIFDPSLSDGTYINKKKTYLSDFDRGLYLSGTMSLDSGGSWTCHGADSDASVLAVNRDAPSLTFFTATGCTDTAAPASMNIVWTADVNGTVTQSGHLLPSVTDGSLALGTTANYWGQSQIDALADAVGVVAVAPYGRTLNDPTGATAFNWSVAGVTQFGSPTAIWATTTDPVSPSPITGEMYFNSATGNLRTYNGTAWSDVGSNLAGKGWVKYTLTFDQFTDPTTSHTLNVVNVPAGSIVEAWVVHPTIAFGGGAITDVVYSFGNDLNGLIYTTNTELFTAPSDTVYTNEGLFTPIDFGASHFIQFQANSTGDNLDQLTAGSVDVFIKFKDLNADASEQASGSGGVKVDAPTITTPTGSAPILFNSSNVEYQTDPAFTTTANTITAPTTGLFTLSMSSHANIADSSPHVIQLFYQVNSGSPIPMEQIVTSPQAGSDHLYSMSTPLSLNAGDALIFFAVGDGTFDYDQITIALNGTGGGSGGGSGANFALSNLSSPTAINQNLFFATGTSAVLQTKDEAAKPQDLLIQTGMPTVTDTEGGSLSLNTGNVTGVGQGGNLILTTGTSVDGSGGTIGLATGTSTGIGESGPIAISTGPNSGTGTSGNMQITTGSAAAAASGGIDITTGNAGTSSSTSGAFRVFTGNGFSSGEIDLTTGQAAIDTATGAMTFDTGDASGIGQSGGFNVNTGQTADGNSGGLSLLTGQPSGTGTSGAVSIQSGSPPNAGGSGGSGGVTLKSGETGSGGSSSGSVLVTSGGNSSGSTGSAQLLSGAAGSGGGSGSVSLASGGGGSSGSISISTGGASSSAGGGSIFISPGAGSTTNGEIILGETHIRTTGTAPTLSSCGTSPSFVGNATDIAGRIQVGSGTFSSCTLTFHHAYNQIPVCIFQAETTSYAVAPTVPSSSAITFGTSVAFGANDKVVYHCFGLQ